MVRDDTRRALGPSDVRGDLGRSFLTRRPVAMARGAVITALASMVTVTVPTGSACYSRRFTKKPPSA